MKSSIPSGEIAQEENCLGQPLFITEQGGNKYSTRTGDDNIWLSFCRAFGDLPFLLEINGPNAFFPIRVFGA